MIRKNRLSRTRRLDWKGLSNPFGKKNNNKGERNIEKRGKEITTNKQERESTEESVAAANVSM